MSELALDRTHTPTTLPAPTKGKPERRLKIGRKLQIAIDAIVFDGAELDKAAETAKCTTRSIRRAFEKAHVLTYLKKRREVLRASARGQNIRRLVQIRDAADNMPAVQAIRELERMDESDAIEGSARRNPGVVIIVQNGTVNAPLTHNEPKPLIIQGDVSHEPE